MSGMNIGINSFQNIPADQKGSVEYLEYNECDMKPEVSNENMQVSTERMRFEDCVEQCGSPRKKMLIFSKNINKETQACKWTFYLNGYVSSGVLNDFVNKMLLVKAKDSVFIHAPSEASLDDAEVIYGAVKNCASKDVTISAPYTMDACSTYIALCGKKLLWSPACVMHVDSPRVYAGGRVSDAMNMFNCEVYRRELVLNTLLQSGFINGEDLAHINENQGQVVLYGARLKSAIEAFNNKA